ncbi:peptidoglycan DD-metalloendopeptidase family protein [Luteimonas sp. A478]
MTSSDPASDSERNRLVRIANLDHVAAGEARSVDSAQGQPRGFTGRWSRRQWGQASLLATAGALIFALLPAGFSSAMQADSGNMRMSTMALALPLAPAPAKDAAPSSYWETVTVQPGQTLGEIFSNKGVPVTLLHSILETASAEKALGRIRPGTELGFEFDPDTGSLSGFRFELSNTERVELAVAGTAITEHVIERPVEVHTAVISGEIRNSLFGSARQAGLSPNAIATLTDRIFQYDIDFARQVQPGDRYSAVVEELWREGERVGSGEVVAATFTTGGKTFTGFRFENDGKVEYYDANGRPLKRSFIRSPIEFARLSSRFGSRRHPILGTMRMHNGVDYAARTGTPIMAAGDARVQFRGRQRGYGNTVILDHGRGHTTLYAHMSRFGNARQGERVSQGQVIGYVGATGLATGPHLHYEFRVNGAHRDPLKVTMPPPEPLKGATLARFKAETAPTLARMEQYETLHYARRQAETAPALASAGDKASGDRG